MVSEFPRPLPADQSRDDTSFEQSLAFLEWFDTMFIIDDSASMEPYWADVKALLQAITPICAKYDNNGVDLFFVNHRAKGYIPGLSSISKSGYRNIGQVHGTGKQDSCDSIFSDVKPKGKCQLGGRLKKVLGSYMSKMEADEERAALNVIVITAGILDDDLRDVLVSTAKQLDQLDAPEHQVGIQLFQVGNDAKVREMFEHLDDEVYKEANTRDIVDTVTWNGTLSTDEMLKVVLGAVSKSIDARKAGFAGRVLPQNRSW